MSPEAEALREKLADVYCFPVIPSEHVEAAKAVCAAIVEELGITEEAIDAVDSGNWESGELRYRAVKMMRNPSTLLELANHGE